MNSSLVTLVVDRDQKAREELARNLEADPRVGTVLTVGTANDAMALLRKERPGERLPPHPVTGRPGACSDVDIAFIDYRTPGLDGRELATLFGAVSLPPSVVFLTEPGAKGSELFASAPVDYLVKPVQQPDLINLVSRVAPTRNMATPGGGPRDDDVIAVELGGTTTLLRRGQIRYVEAQGDYVRLHTTDGRSHLARMSLDTLTRRWREAGFFRVHRSYLAPLALLSELRYEGSSYIVTVGRGPGAAQLPVARRRATELKQLLVGPAKTEWARRQQL